MKFTGWVEISKTKKNHVGVRALSIALGVSSAAALPYLLVLGLFCRKFGSPSNQRISPRMQTPSESTATPKARHFNEISKREE